MHRPVNDVVAASDRLEIARNVVRARLSAVDQVVPHEQATDRVAAAAVHGRVVHFLDFDREYIAVFFKGNRHRLDLTPPVGRVRFDDDGLGLDDEVGRADLPGVGVAPVLGWWHVSRIAARGTAVGPLRDHGDFGGAQRRIVLVPAECRCSFPCTRAA